MAMNEYKLSILKASFKQRTRDVWLHEVNIKNYRDMITTIDAIVRQAENKPLSDYRVLINNHLVSAAYELDKENVSLFVITAQLKEEGVDIDALTAEAATPDPVEVKK